ncbi:hypothetical protein KIPB_011939, partial [Kipferlia bialata]
EYQYHTNHFRSKELAQQAMLMGTSQTDAMQGLGDTTMERMSAAQKAALHQRATGQRERCTGRKAAFTPPGL